MSEERKSFEVLGEPIKYEPAPLLERESSYIETKCGKAFVIREGKPTKYSILTLHDIGLNSSNCFDPFIHLPDAWEIFKNFQIIHLHYPGHEEGSSNNSNTPIKYRDFMNLISAVLDVLNVELVLCMGVGFGATLLTHFGLHFPNKMLGLISIGPVSPSSGWKEWVQNQVLSKGLYLGFKSYSVHQLLGRYFTEETLENPYDLLEIYTRDVSRIHPNSIRNYIQTVNDRPELNFFKLEFDTLVLVGRESSLYEEGEDYCADVCPSRMELVEFENMAHLLTVQCPNLLVDPVRLFFQGQGLSFK